MTDQEALGKLIQTAIDRGWKEPNGNTLSVDDDGRLFSFLKDSSIKTYGYQSNLEALLFNKDFNKALFGEKSYEFIIQSQYLDIYKQGEIRTIKAYQHHMQQAVISDNPIQYLVEQL